MIEARNVHKVYRAGAVPLAVLKGITLSIDKQEFVAITGPSGAGKSTLLHLLAGLDTPTEGEVCWQGRSLSRMSEQERAHWRNHTIGIVFQFYHLLPELSAVENVMLPGLVSARGGSAFGGNGQRRRQTLEHQAQHALTQVGLRERASHKPSQLSGGELQRVAIARALINRPKVIFCDEPTGNLDSQTGQAVAQLLMTLHQEQGMSLVLITHEEELAKLADRWLVLRDGQLVSDSRPQKSDVRLQT